MKRGMTDLIMRLGSYASGSGGVGEIMAELFDLERIRDRRHPEHETTMGRFDRLDRRQYGYVIMEVCKINGSCDQVDFESTT
jgi:hypothetical protein